MDRDGGRFHVVRGDRIGSLTFPMVCLPSPSIPSLEERREFALQSLCVALERTEGNVVLRSRLQRGAMVTTVSVADPRFKVAPEDALERRLLTTAWEFRLDAATMLDGPEAGEPTSASRRRAEVARIAFGHPDMRLFLLGSTRVNIGIADEEFVLADTNIIGRGCWVTIRGDRVVRIGRTR